MTGVARETHRKCPVCGADDSVACWRKSGFTVVRCSGCGMRYTNPVPVEFDGSYYADRSDSFYLAADKLAPVALIILFSTVPFAMEFLALKRLPPRVFGVLLSLEPGIAALVGLALLGEHLAALGWLALFLVSAGSAGATLARER